MNKKKQIRKELKNYLDIKLEKGDFILVDEVVNFIKKDRKKQLLIHDVVCSRLCYCEKKEIEQKVKDKFTGIMNWW